MHRERLYVVTVCAMPKKKPSESVVARRVGTAQVRDRDAQSREVQAFFTLSHCCQHHQLSTQEEGQVSGSNVPPAEAPHAPTLDLLTDFGRRLAARIAPHLDDAAVQQAVLATQRDMHADQQENLPQGGESPPMMFKLVYAHSCWYVRQVRTQRHHHLYNSNMACTKMECMLCKHNPRKRCVHNFAPKYWVSDKVTAKCGAHIELELIDCATNARCDTLPANLAGVTIQVRFVWALQSMRAVCRVSGFHTTMQTRGCIGVGLVGICARAARATRALGAGRVCVCVDAELHVNTPPAPCADGAAGRQKVCAAVQGGW